MRTVPFYILAAIGIYTPFPHTIDKALYTYLSTL